jgi:hypothetical protein
MLAIPNHGPSIIACGCALGVFFAPLLGHSLVTRLVIVSPNFPLPLAAYGAAVVFNVARSVPFFAGRAFKERVAAFLGRQPDGVLPAPNAIRKTTATALP